MSIPNPFRPVCGGANELPYVQPIMTSDTTWSNEPSFGMTLTPSQYLHWASYYSFRHLDPLPSVFHCALLWSADQIDPLQIRISFERDVKIKAVTWQYTGYSSAPVAQRVELWAETKKVLDVEAYKTETPIKHYIQTPLYARNYFLRPIYPEKSSLAFPTNVIFEAYYKP